MPKFSVSEKSQTSEAVKFGVEMGKLELLKGEFVAAKTVADKALDAAKSAVGSIDPKTNPKIIPLYLEKDLIEAALKIATAGGKDASRRDRFLYRHALPKKRTIFGLLKRYC